MNYVVSALALISLAITMGIKLYKRSFWIVRVKKTAFGKLIVPNSVVLLSLFSVVFFIANIAGNAFFQYAYKHPDRRLS